jgi:hypothetical protein
MIDLSRTCGTAATLICNALVIFMIYPWIKIKLKVLIYPTIQKPYCRHFSFVAGFVDALRPTPFTSVNFKRWQMRVTLWLTVNMVVSSSGDGTSEYGNLPYVLSVFQSTTWWLDSSAMFICVLMLRYSLLTRPPRILL